MKIKYTDELIYLSYKFDFYSITPITVKVYYGVGFYFNATRNRLDENYIFFLNTRFDWNEKS